MSPSDARHQRLAAILVADAAGYSRLMSGDEAGTLAALEAARACIRSQVAHLDEDRYFYTDLVSAERLVSEGALIEAVAGVALPAVTRGEK